MKSWTLALLTGVVLATGAACDKGAQPSAKASGPLGGDDLKLFTYLPKGNSVLLGGNYMKFQNFMQSSLGQMVGKLGPGMKEWTECWTKASGAKIAAAVKVNGSRAEMRMAFSGMKMPQLKECADKASYKAELDPDGKYITIEIEQMGQTVHTSYLDLGDGIVYSMQAFSFPMPQMVQTPRADLEADAAKAKNGNATDDKDLIALASKVDRTKTMWFVGNAANTPLADKVSWGWGAVDILPGITMDVTVKFAQEDLAKKVSEGVAQVKDHAGELPADVRPMIKRLTVSRNGGQIRMTANITDAEMSSLMKQAGMFGAF